MLGKWFGLIVVVLLLTLGISLVAAHEEHAKVGPAVTILNGFNPAHNFMVADLAGLVAGVNLNENTPEPPGCMSMPMDPDCMTLFPGFGLNIVEGVTQVADTQSFFRMQ